MFLCFIQILERHVLVTVAYNPKLLAYR